MPARDRVLPVVHWQYQKQQLAGGLLIAGGLMYTGSTVPGLQVPATTSAAMLTMSGSWCRVVQGQQQLVVQTRRSLSQLRGSGS